MKGNLLPKARTLCTRTLTHTCTHSQKHPQRRTMRVTSGICAVALLLSVLWRPAGAAVGDVIAASDFRLGTQGWQLSGSGWSSDGIQSEGDLIAAVDSPATPGSIWYYSAPSSFVSGDKALAYNGFLSFDFGHFEYESMGKGTVPGYDIMLFGKNKKQTLGLKGAFRLFSYPLAHVPMYQAAARQGLTRCTSQACSRWTRRSSRRRTMCASRRRIWPTPRPPCGSSSTLSSRSTASSSPRPPPSTSS